MVTDKTMSTAPNRLNGLFPRLSVIGLALIVWKVATNPEGAAKTQLFKKSPSRYPWSKMQNGQQNAGRSATLEIYALLLGMGKWRGTSVKALQGVPKGGSKEPTQKNRQKNRGNQVHDFDFCNAQQIQADGQNQKGTHTGHLRNDAFSEKGG